MKIKLEKTLVIGVLISILIGAIEIFINPEVSNFTELTLLGKLGTIIFLATIITIAGGLITSFIIWLIKLFQ